MKSIIGNAKSRLYAEVIRLVARFPWLPHALVAASYVLLVVYYMTPEVMHCSTTVDGFGDNTAGPIWRYWASPHSPFWGQEKLTNYPYGDNLSNPVNFSGSLQYIFYWLLAKVLGPVCGYNFLNFIGLVATALAMYGLIRFLTRKSWIAWFAGYAVAFTPYFQVKIGGHPSYAYQALLIGTIWAFLSVIKTRKRSGAIVLGLLTAACFYLDPYFILLEALVLGGFGFAWLVLFVVSQKRGAAKEKKNTRSQLRVLVIAAIIAVSLILPLAAIKISKSAEINSYVSSARGNVLYEARACSNWPHEYLLPFVLHPTFEHLFGKARYQSVLNSLDNFYHCGIGEDSVGLSLTLLAVVMFAGSVVVWERLSGRRIKFSGAYYDPRLVIGGAAAAGILAVAIGLPPVHYHGIPSPSYELLQITHTWRTLTRVYVVVNISLVITAAFALAFFADAFRKHPRFLRTAFVVIILLVAVEYQAFTPFRGNTLSTFNYQTSAPETYYWLAKQRDIKTVAEYPLERYGGESDALSYYLTMQKIHGKPILNSALPNSPQDSLRSGLKSLSDPQTIPVLKQLGVDTVIIHGVSKQQVEAIPYLRIIHTAPQANFNLLPHTPTVKYDNIIVAKIVQTPPEANVLELGTGFARNTLIINSAADWQYEATQDSQLHNVSLSAKPVSGDACFAIKMAAPHDQDQLTIKLNGKSAKVLRITDTYQSIAVPAATTITLHLDHGHNMRVTKLGCD